MHKDEIPLAFVCDQRVADMPVDATGTRRHCQSCDVQVHDLSALTQVEARAIVQDPRGRCLCFTHDASGRVYFADDPPLRPSKLRGRPRVRLELAAAALLASIFAIGCAYSEVEKLDIAEPELQPEEDGCVIPWDDPVEPHASSVPEPEPEPTPTTTRPRRHKRIPPRYMTAGVPPD